MATARFPGKSADVAAGNWSSPPGRLVCVNGTPWILYLLEECVDNVWEYCSVVIGLISMFCFLLSTLPQVYEAYRNGKGRRPCRLAFSSSSSVITVVFYIFTDLILISQFLYYKIKNSSSRKSPVLKWLCFMWCGSASLVLLTLPKLIVDNSASLDTKSTSRSVEITGYVCGYLASVFYLSSRFPQLYKNRQSTEGTSYMLFALAMMGNGTYGLSVIVVLPALKGSKQTFIIKHLAWLIGSLGSSYWTSLYPLKNNQVTAQFVMYRKNSSAKGSKLLSVPEVEPLLCEEVELSLL
ncbi:hypothetical protein F7725_021116 [Dissostichus mawsoni]|uniref:Lysosomal amino acid transporter 1 homolog n=1 Tax=Dissostichus mawsoni TaxID=36200 RepID=A0A7J5YIH0_DISMA|nr:hypothetical protein F7725_021116 [Dissostichus mawsoni]